MSYKILLNTQAKHQNATKELLHMTFEGATAAKFFSTFSAISVT